MVRNGEVCFKEKEHSAKPFTKLQPEKIKMKPSCFMTMDIETVRDENNNLNPYLVGGYHNGRYISSFASNLSTEAQEAILINLLLKSLLLILFDMFMRTTLVDLMRCTYLII